MPAITFRVSDLERSDLIARSSTEGVSLSEFIRRSLRLRDAADDLSDQVRDHEHRIGRLEGMAGLA
jgi:hypothetical protein